MTQEFLLITVNYETGEETKWFLNDLLKYINSDRSEDWIDYNESDFVEGLHEWTDEKLLGITFN